jgi:dephospho-CoA kinase
LGAHVIDADVLAREAIKPGTAGHRRVLAAFGTVDRDKLRDIVFRDPRRRRELEQIIHPEVARLRSEKEAALERAGVDVVVNDIPLLFEAELQNEADIIVLVDAPRATRVQRMVENRGIASQEAERMVDAQMPAEQKRSRATFIIENAGTLEQLRQQAQEVWQKIRARASA